MNERDKNNIQCVLELMDEALEALAAFPTDFVPKSSLVPELTPLDDEEGLAGVDRLLSKPGAWEKLDAIQGKLPDKFFNAFSSCTLSLGQGLARFGPPVHEYVDDLTALMYCIRKPDLFPAVSHLLESPGGDRQRAIIRHFKNFMRIQTTPFSKTITTFLGEFSLGWYASPSETGIPRLQLHEFSRDGWASLDRIRDQMLIEEELGELQAVVPTEAKLAVALCWTISGLASFVDEVIFLGEHQPRVSSLRETQVTVSYGRVTREMQPFECNSMRRVIQFCQNALKEPEITACDMMWMATGIASRPVIHIGHQEYRRPQQRFSTFLSHRGCDSKAELAAHIQSDIPEGMTTRAFLDCLCMPKRMINRKFVFESLASSEQVLIVESPNFTASEWCRKEVWFAEQLQSLAGKSVSRGDLKTAIAKGVILEAFQKETSVKVRPWLVSRCVLNDQHAASRAPNLRTLSADNRYTALVRSLEQLHPDLAKGFVAISSETRDRLFAHLPRWTTADDIADWTLDQKNTWAVVCQHVLSIMTPLVTAASKEAVWNVVDRIIKTIEDICCLSRIAAHESFHDHLENYLSVISAAGAFDLWYDSTGYISEELISSLVGGVAIVHDHTILLDVRSPRERDLKLRLAVALIFHDLGGFGIIQNAHDPVHNQVIDSQDLSVLPCVTVHPGMEAIFGQPR